MVNKKSEAEDPEMVIEAALDQSENFLYRNGKKMLIGLGVVTVVLALVFAVKYLYLEPKEVEASAAMYKAQLAFGNDLYEQALEGDATSLGFLSVIDQYSSTACGNVAYHYAGICYMNLGEYQKALDYLSKYSKVDDGTVSDVINAQNLGLQGDANMQLGDSKKAAKCYEKAIAASENSLTAPYYLKKIGMIYQKEGDSKKALEAYKTIKTEYFRSLEARDVEKLIGQIEK